MREGYVYPKVEVAQKQYARWFSEPGTTVPRKCTFTEKYYDILSSTTVLFTGIGKIENDLNVVSTTPRYGAYTILWLKKNGRWKALNMHLSWKSRRK